jgi:hypothetical protein
LRSNWGRILIAKLWILYIFYPFFKFLNFKWIFFRRNLIAMYIINGCNQFCQPFSPLSPYKNENQNGLVKKCGWRGGKGRVKKGWGMRQEKGGRRGKRGGKSEKIENGERWRTKGKRKEMSRLEVGKKYIDERGWKIK